MKRGSGKNNVWVLPVMVFLFVVQPNVCHANNHDGKSAERLRGRGEPTQAALKKPGAG